MSRSRLGKEHGHLLLQPFVFSLALKMLLNFLSVFLRGPSNTHLQL